MISIFGLVIRTRRESDRVMKVALLVGKAAGRRLGYVEGFARGSKCRPQMIGVEFHFGMPEYPDVLQQAEEIRSRKDDGTVY